MTAPDDVQDNIERLWVSVIELQARNRALTIVLTELFRAGFEGARALNRAKDIARESGSLPNDDPYRDQVVAILESIEEQLRQDPGSLDAKLP